MRRWAVASAITASLIVAGCASAPPAPPSDAAGPCNADVRLGGYFATADEIEFTLLNTSTAPHCVVSQVTLEFESPASRDAVSLSVPAGWSTSDTTCQQGARVCGMVVTPPDAVAAGRTVPGFRLVKPAKVVLRSITVIVGGRSVILLRPLRWTGAQDEGLYRGTSQQRNDEPFGRAAAPAPRPSLAPARTRHVGCVVGS